MEKNQTERIPADATLEMNICFRVGFFDSRRYRAYVKPTALQFVSDEDTFSVPYEKIKSVTMNGASLFSEGFLLETDEGTHSGCLDSLKDAKRFLEGVGDRMQGRLTLNLSRT